MSGLCSSESKLENPYPGKVQMRDQHLGGSGKTDFTEIWPIGGCQKDVLVFMHSLSRWMHMFSIQAETLQMVAKKGPPIVPWFSLPLAMESNNGPTFIAKTFPLVAKGLDIVWILHCIYRPQSSGQVKTVNWTLKETLTKLSIESSK